MIQFIYVQPSNNSCVGTTYPLTGSFDLAREAVVADAEFYYPFESFRGGRTCDLSPHARTATISLSAGDDKQTGVIGYGVKINPGVDQIYYNNFNDTPNITGGFTIAQFVKSSYYVDGLGAEGIFTFFASGQTDPHIFIIAEVLFTGIPRIRFSFLDTNDGKYRGYVGSFSGPAINDNQWHHVAWVFSDDKTTITSYVDGVFSGSEVPFSNFAAGGTSSNSVTGACTFELSGNKSYHFDNFGSQPNNTPPMWLDETGFWSRALSQTEIQSLMKQKSPYNIYFTETNGQNPSNIVSQINLLLLNFENRPDGYSSSTSYINNISISGPAILDPNGPYDGLALLGGNIYYAFAGIKATAAGTITVTYPAATNTLNGIPNATTSLTFTFVPGDRVGAVTWMNNTTTVSIPVNSPTNVNPLVAYYYSNIDFDFATVTTSAFIVTNGTVTSVVHYANRPNAMWVTISPTSPGTVSIDLPISGGIKSVFGHSYSAGTSSIVYSP